MNGSISEISLGLPIFKTNMTGLPGVQEGYNANEIIACYLFLSIILICCDSIMI